MIYRIAAKVPHHLIRYGLPASGPVRVPLGRYAHHPLRSKLLQWTNPPNDRVLRHGTTRMPLQDKPAVSGREREAGEVRGPALVTQLAVLVSQT
jgi:hypothetical protein